MWAVSKTDGGLDLACGPWFADPYSNLFSFSGVLSLAPQRLSPSFQNPWSSELHQWLLRAWTSEFDKLGSSLGLATCQLIDLEQVTSHL